MSKNEMVTLEIPAILHEDLMKLKILLEQATGKELQDEVDVISLLTGAFFESLQGHSHDGEDGCCGGGCGCDDGHDHKHAHHGHAH